MTRGRWIGHGNAMSSGYSGRGSGPTIGITVEGIGDIPTGMAQGMDIGWGMGMGMDMGWAGDMSIQGIHTIQRDTIVGGGMGEDNKGWSVQRPKGSNPHKPRNRCQLVIVFDNPPPFR